MATETAANDCLKVVEVHLAVGTMEKFDRYLVEHGHFASEGF